MTTFTIDDTITLQDLPAGRFIVGVSGGVDSMVLLDLVRQRTDITAVIAHYDHGIRAESPQDRNLVKYVAMSHNLEFISERGYLGPHTSEDTARKARYSFLRQMRKIYNADAIVTAHHQDDLLETAIINMIRGTGRRGLSALRSTNELKRPLLSYNKQQLYKYAVTHDLQWHEDITNQDLTHLRNVVRHHLLSHFKNTHKTVLYDMIVRQEALNRRLDADLNALLISTVQKQASLWLFPRQTLIMLPMQIAYELLQLLYKQCLGTTVERKHAERALLFAKTARHAKQFPLTKGWRLRIQGAQVIVEPTTSVLS
jgi:tRNA(Ile)-lysidine synthase